jgi:hypothetical protein
VASTGAAQFLSAVSQPASKMAFTGNYQIVQCHHYENSRLPRIPCRKRRGGDGGDLS